MTTYPDSVTYSQGLPYLWSRLKHVHLLTRASNCLVGLQDQLCQAPELVPPLY